MVRKAMGWAERVSGNPEKIMTALVVQAISGLLLLTC